MYSYKEFIEYLSEHGIQIIYKSRHSMLGLYRYFIVVGRYNKQ